MGPGPIGRDVAAHGQVVLRSSPRGSKSQGARQRRAAAWWSPAGSVSEPARLETASNTPQDLTSRPIASPGQTKNPGTSTETNKILARKRTHRSPMLTHETSPVSGASVVGMTYGACQGPGNMPAGVPGVFMVLAREDRLRPKGRLRQQPAGNSTEESRSRAMKTKALQPLFRRKWAGPDKNDRGKGRE
jgi:hypothetical protein